MRLGIVSILVLFFSASLLAQEKKEATKASILADLASANTLERPGRLEKQAADDWNKAVDNVGALVTKNSDKALKDSYTALTHANNDLVNALKVSAGQCVDSDQFVKVETAATKAKNDLKKATFILAGKRATREVLVKLADYLVNTAKVGSHRAQICKDIAALPVLADWHTKFKRTEAIARKAGKKINATALLRDKLKSELDAFSKIEKKYLHKEQEKLKALKAKKSLKERDLKTVEDALAKINSSVEKVDGWFVAYEVPTDDQAAAISLANKTIDFYKAEIEGFAENIQQVEDSMTESMTAHNDAKEARVAIAKAEKDLDQVEQDLAFVSGNAESILAEYKKSEAKANEACGIKQGTGLKACLTRTLINIKKAAPAAKLTKQCSDLSENSGLVDINTCAKAAGKK